MAEGAVERWDEDGFVILPRFLSSFEIAAAVAELRDVFPTAAGFGSGGVADFPVAGVEINLLCVHPRVVGLAASLLRTDDLRLLSASVRADYPVAAGPGEGVHRRGPSLAGEAPGYDAGIRQVGMILYLSDVTEADGPPRFASRSGAQTVTAAGPAGTVVAYEIGTYRGPGPLTAPSGERFTLHLNFRPAAAGWAVGHGWADRSRLPAWDRFAKRASPRQLALFGLPAPSSSRPRTGSAPGWRRRLSRVLVGMGLKQPPAGPWLSGGRAQGGGLLYPGHPPGLGVADLLLAPEYVALRARGVVALLRWEEFYWPGAGGLPRRDHWSLEPWWSGRGGPTGVGLAAQGGCEIATRRVRVVSGTWRSRTARFVGQPAPVIPLHTLDTLKVSGDADRGVVEALCGLLASRPAIRARLAEPDRVDRLVADLVAHPLSAVEPRLGVRRSTVEVMLALRALGHEHRHGGRPLPGEPHPALDDLVPKVLARVGSNPYARGIEVKPQHARRVIQRRYLDVEPWPFGALLLGADLQPPTP